MLFLRSLISSALVAATGLICTQPFDAFAAGNAPQPNICTRACWGARAASGITYMGALTRAIVHHTAGSEFNTSGLEASKANVRAVQNLHMSNGWGDIGYHFLVDKFGNIFEGRFNSMGALPRGAHDGTNTNSFGFNVMGYFHPSVNNVPTAAMMNSLYAVIAWRMPNGWSPYGSPGVYGPLGNSVGYLDAHRRVNATACPGDHVYNPYMGSNVNAGVIRAEVFARINVITLNSAPDVVSWGQGRMDVVVRGSNNNVYHRTYINGAWQGWANLGAQCNGSPSICSMWPGRLDVFMRGYDNNLWHNAGNGAGTWWGWENLGDTLTASPDCVSRGDGKIDVVFRGSNNDVWHRWMNGWAWVGYNNQGLDANGDPTICAMPDGRLDIFARGFDNNLWHNAGPGNNTWWGWENLGDFLSSNPDAVSRGLGKVDVAFRGSSDDVWHRWMDGYAWSGYNNQGLEAASDPTICAMPDGRLDMYATGYDGCLWHNAGPGNNTWWGWENLGKP
jgi:hypothetical protein